jgi:hypothetical protein
MPNKMKSNNPPRRVEIRGQDHLLAYITPAEAQLLMDNGGAGLPGPMGIPAFYGFGSHDDASSQVDYGGSDDKDDRPSADAGNIGSGSDEDLDQSVQQDLAAAAAAAQGVDLGGYQFDEGFDPGSRQTARDVYNTMMDIRTATGLSSKAARDQILGYARNQLENRMINANALMKGYPVSFLGKTFNIPSIPGIMGGLLGKANLSQIGSVLDTPGSIPAFDVTGKLQGAYDARGIYSGNDTSPIFDDGKGRDDTVPATYNPITGESQCPDGYVFDADLQACRLDTTLQNVGDTVGGDGFTYQPGTYARMGLLDVAPEGLEGFASTYGTGFGTAPDYEAANLAYRKPVGTMSGIFQDPYNLQGMTLLS